MTYHDLSKDTAQTPERRVEEAHEITKLLSDVIEQMNPNEQTFVEAMGDCVVCSPKQLFWLRDLKDKYL